MIRIFKHVPTKPTWLDLYFNSESNNESKCETKSITQKIDSKTSWNNIVHILENETDINTTSLSLILKQPLAEHVSLWPHIVSVIPTAQLQRLRLSVPISKYITIDSILPLLFTLVKQSLVQLRLTFQTLTDQILNPLQSLFHNITLQSSTPLSIPLQVFQLAVQVQENSNSKCKGGGSNHTLTLHSPTLKMVQLALHSCLPAIIDLYLPNVSILSLQVPFFNLRKRREMTRLSHLQIGSNVYTSSIQQLIDFPFQKPLVTCRMKQVLCANTLKFIETCWRNGCWSGTNVDWLFHKTTISSQYNKTMEQMLQFSLKHGDNHNHLPNNLTLTSYLLLDQCDDLQGCILFLFVKYLLRKKVNVIIYLEKPNHRHMVQQWENELPDLAITHELKTTPFF
jgi:hypothetical protein